MYPEIDSLVSSLVSCHWGPRPATAIVTRPYEPGTQGVMNLVYAVQEGQEIPNELIWFSCVAIGKSVIRKYPIHEWATIYRPPKFYKEIIEPNSILFRIKPLSYWKEFCLEHD